MSGKYEHLIVRGVSWTKSLPDHEGSVGKGGFPILMNGELVSEANAWVCPTMVVPDAETVAMVAAGKGAKANPHIHDEDEMYLVLGEPDQVRIVITLGEDTYEVSSPAAVYIPAGLPHSIRGSKLTEGTYCGTCQVVIGKKYVTKPVPENPLKLDDTEHLIVRNIQWVNSLPDHEGSVNGKGFPILMNSSLVPEANAWVCPTLVTAQQVMIDQMKSGAAPKANPHTHDEDEMYIVFGEEDAVRIKITLGDEEYEVSSPGAVYIPAGLPHSICASKLTVGKYGGSCQIVIGKEYITKPV